LDQSPEVKKDRGKKGGRKRRGKGIPEAGEQKVGQRKFRNQLVGGGRKPRDEGTGKKTRARKKEEKKPGPSITRLLTL